MIFSYLWFQSFFKSKLPEPKKLAELLTIHSFEVKEIRRAGLDYTLEIDVLPNRGDCFSHLGLAREIGAILNFRPKPLEIKLRENKELKDRDVIEVRIKDKSACFRYTARVIDGVRIGPSPNWIREKLKICGLRPINNVVDIVNYVMLETGQPLHAFDGRKLEGRKIIVRFAKDGEKIITLDGEKYNLSSDILVIADGKKPVAIAGIKGGEIPEIDKKTGRVVLESANFNPLIVRRNSRKLNLRTDASLRFEHGIDPNLTELAIDRAAFLIRKISGGKAVRGLIDFYPGKVLSKKIKLELDYVKSLLGIELSKKEIINILRRLDFKIVESGLHHIKVEVPTRRLDLSVAEDLIEEIGRIYGYEKIPSILPTACLTSPRRNTDIFWKNMVKNILERIGFSEVCNYSFVSQRETQLFDSASRSNLVEVENPVSSEQKYLRPSLVPNLLKNIRANQKHFEQIKIFELGKVFSNSKKVEEKRELGGVIKGEQFYQVKGVMDLLLKKLGISQVYYQPYSSQKKASFSFWHSQRSAKIEISGKQVGFLGEIKPQFLEGLGIKGRVAGFCLDFEKLKRFCSEEVIYQPVSSYPAAVRDIAVLVPRKVKVVDVLNEINILGGSLVRDVDLFDVYQGEELSSQKKNLAFHIIYQAEDRTLSSGEIDRVHQKIIKGLEKNSAWEVRK